MNDEVFGLGLGCGGEVEIWLEPIDWWKTADGISVRMQIRRAFDSGTPIVLSTVLRRDGRPLSTVERAVEDRSIPRSRRERGDGQDLFVDRLDPPRMMILLGSGADTEPLARISSEAGFHVTVICEGAADRQRQRFPTATVVSRPGGKLGDLSLRGRPAVVLATHKTTTDREALRSLLPRLSELSYLGILGPRSRTESLLAELTADGLSLDPDTVHRIHGPAGLDLGSDAPGEIALSIVAEALAAANQRSARPLRDKQKPGSTTEGRATPDRTSAG